jgi:hypothetical protein
MDDRNVAQPVHQIVSTSAGNHHAGITARHAFQQLPRQRTHVRAVGSGDNRRKGSVVIERDQQVR